MQNRNVAAQLVAALQMAERFMRGFEGDELNSGMGPSLAKMRAAIAAGAAIATVIPKEKRTHLVCSTCGSDDVRKDAWAEWDHVTGTWVLGQVFDACHCEKCEGETSLEEITAAAFADLQELASDERSEANGLAMMEGRLEDMQP